MKRTKQITLAVALICLLSHAACSGSSEDASKNTAELSTNAKAAGEGNAPDDNVVRVSAPEVRLKAGGSGEAVVRLKIAEGFHVNANPPSDKFLIPTSLDVQVAEGLKAGRAVYPAGVTKKFGFSEKPLAVYEGEVSISLPLSAEAGAAKGRRTLDASVTVQPCNDTECFQKRVVNAAVPVVIE